MSLFIFTTLNESKALTAIDVADVMAAIAVGVAQQKGRPVAAPRALHQPHCRSIHGAHVLPIHLFGQNAKRLGPRRYISGSGFGVMRVLVVKIVLANVNDGQFPELGQIHFFVQQPLPQRALAEETHRHLPRAALFRGERRAGGNARAPPDDGVRAQVTCLLIGNVHRAAFAPAITGLFAEQLREHAIHRRAFGQAMPVSAMRAGDVVVAAQGFTHANGHRLLPDVQMRQPRHLRGSVKLVDLLFELADFRHLLIGVQPVFGVFRRILEFWIWSMQFLHSTPDILANTSNITAKSCSAQPMPRAAVRNSLVAAVVGSGTSNCRPISNARFISFCIMSTSNQASSGIFNTNGPRYFTMGEAITLLSRTSTATSRLMPLFSASSTPSLKASICTARLKLVAIFIETANPFLPT